MKILILTLLSLLTYHQSFAGKSLEIALEPNSIKVEYYATSGRGLIYVYDCEDCEKYYKFNTAPIIRRQGKIISFDEFLSDYRNGKVFALFLHKENKTVLRINY